MKAAIVLSKCAAGSSLFSDAPRPHWAPLSLIHCLWETHCAEKETLRPRPLWIDVPFSFVFTCLNGRVGLSSAPDWPLLLPVGRETALLAHFLTDVPFSSVFFIFHIGFRLCCISRLLPPLCANCSENIRMDMAVVTQTNFIPILLICPWHCWQKHHARFQFKIARLGSTIY